MRQGTRIGIDLGGTKISSIAFDPADNVLAHERVPTPHNDYEAAVRTIKQVTLGLEARFGPASVGIGMPGSISPSTKTCSKCQFHLHERAGFSMRS